ncbi:dienelactone hydrolase family protein [Streptomyces europaeiscabiei]|jgi:dienelactone hydrolase|uniref:Dienelactone hydrolase family protein n=1 Tax=Streptomyces europaeiscabiei TaxID=146819 RepID=A0AAJ2PYT8_9ACTN|nr:MULTISPECIES: dienelactone hydrolase family protein [Streptomyces]KFF95496.1 lipase [Streptomyces scabiei]MDX3135632.1 dienelactone hydrolase family protein [Streptomyces europaeiscabiei]MDX3697889.1 dienelactone hydrolase family protein [Streptomyces europaeiscabiei]
MATLAIVASIALATPAQAGSSNPYQRGPNPTEAIVTAVDGPFATASVNVPSGSGPGFNNGTVYYPTDTSQGSFGSIVVMPGFLAGQSQIAWYGPRLASHGFVVLTLDSKAPWDPPGDRGSQLLAALDYLTTTSTVKSRIDPSRSALMGWSMGGGGTLQSAASTPSLKAAIPLAPWDVTNVGDKVKVPTMIFGADGDRVASVDRFALPAYNAMTNAPEKAFVNLKNADHFTFAKANTTIAKYSVSWLKRFVDNDTRYDQFLCPAPNDPNTVAFLNTCPL